MCDPSCAAAKNGGASLEFFSQRALGINAAMAITANVTKAQPFTNPNRAPSRRSKNPNPAQRTVPRKSLPIRPAANITPSAITKNAPKSAISGLSIQRINQRASSP